MGVLEYRVGWNAAGTNPGVSVFHGRITGGVTAGNAAQSHADRIRKFFDDVKTLCAGNQAWSFPGEVLELNTSTGQLEDVHTVTPPAAVASTGSGVYSAPAGVRCEWRTDAIVNGRRLRGRTFLVPTTTSAMDSNGTIAATALVTLASACANFFSTTFFSNAQPCVWSRTHGIQADITSAFLPDEISVMRSRRE